MVQPHAGGQLSAHHGGDRRQAIGEFLLAKVRYRLRRSSESIAHRHERSASPPSSGSTYQIQWPVFRPARSSSIAWANP
jgi:hypothetical protein